MTAMYLAGRSRSGPGNRLTSAAVPLFAPIIDNPLAFDTTPALHRRPLRAGTGPTAAAGVTRRLGVPHAYSRLESEGDCVRAQVVCGRMGKADDNFQKKKKLMRKPLVQKRFSPTTLLAAGRRRHRPGGQAAGGTAVKETVQGGLRWQLVARKMRIVAEDGRQEHHLPAKALEEGKRTVGSL